MSKSVSAQLLSSCESEGGSLRCPGNYAHEQLLVSCWLSLQLHVSCLLTSISNMTAGAEGQHFYGANVKFAEAD